MLTSPDTGIVTRIHAAGRGLDRAAYLAFLRTAFGERWTDAAFDFYLGRSFNGRASEVLVRAQGDRILAGLGICYREVRLSARSAPIRVAVLSAGGTLPAARRTGQYAALLQCMLHRVRDQGCVAALGFVTRRNGSGLGLVRLGARTVPSFYVTSAGRAGRRATGTGGPLPPRRDSRAKPLPVRRYDRRSSAEAGACTAGFHYERDEDWLSQFVHRPNPVRLVRLSHESVALLETVSPADRPYSRARARPVERLQWIACPKAKMTANIARLARASRSLGREFFMYTLDALEAEAARRAGLAIRAGYLMLLPIDATCADWRDLAGSSWRLQSGDRL
jgi:hypothetical protein